LTPTFTSWASAQPVVTASIAPTAMIRLNIERSSLEGPNQERRHQPDFGEY
jgi:hypothetical protein